MDLSDKLTLDEFWTLWRDQSRHRISEGWRISQNQMYRDYISPILGSYCLSMITSPLVGEVFSKANLKEISPQTLKHIYTLIRKIFQDAIDYYEILEKNPVQPRFHKPTVIGKKRAFLLPPQAQLLLKMSRNTEMGPGIWTQILSGLRPGEILALQWKSVLLDLDQILISRIYNTKTRKMQDYPKAKKWEYVPIPKQLKEYLKDRQAEPDELVLKTDLSGEMISLARYGRGIKKLCKRLNLPEVTPHELRHTCTEIYVQAGASMEDLRRLLNHRSLSSTQNYIHRTDDRLNLIAGNLFSNDRSKYEV